MRQYYYSQVMADKLIDGATNIRSIPGVIVADSEANAIGAVYVTKAVKDLQKDGYRVSVTVGIMTDEELMSLGLRRIWEDR